MTILAEHITLFANKITRELLGIALTESEARAYARWRAGT